MFPVGAGPRCSPPFPLGFCRSQTQPPTQRCRACPPPHRRGCWVLSVGGNEMSGGCAGGVFAPVCSVAGGLPRRAGDLQGAGTRPQTGPELRTATPVVGCPRTDTGRMRAGTAEGSLPGRSCQTPPPRRKVGCELPLPIRPWLRCVDVLLGSSWASAAGDAARPGETHAASLEERSQSGGHQGMKQRGRPMGRRPGLRRGINAWDSGRL